MGGIKVLAGLVAMALTCCGGSADVASTQQGVASGESTCPSFGGAGIISIQPDGRVLAAPETTAQETACLSAHCQQVEMCQDRTASTPTCIEYKGGGPLTLWACPSGCCY